MRIRPEIFLSFVEFPLEDIPGIQLSKFWREYVPFQFLYKTKWREIPNACLWLHACILHLAYDLLTRLYLTHIINKPEIVSVPINGRLIRTNHTLPYFISMRSGNVVTLGMPHSRLTTTQTISYVSWILGQRSYHQGQRSK